MGVKKIARPMNKAKNAFLKWLKDNNADNIDIYQSEDSEFDYYVDITGFVDDNLYHVTFMVWENEESIDHSDDSGMYSRISIDKFMELIQDNTCENEI